MTPTRCTTAPSPRSSSRWVTRACAGVPAACCSAASARAAPSSSASACAAVSPTCARAARWPAVAASRRARRRVATRRIPTSRYGGGGGGPDGGVEGGAVVGAGDVAERAVHLVAEGDAVAQGLAGGGAAAGAVHLALRGLGVEGDLVALEGDGLVHEEVDELGARADDLRAVVGVEALEGGVGARGEAGGGGDDQGGVDGAAVLHALLVVEGHEGQLAGVSGDGLRALAEVVERDRAVVGEGRRAVAGRRLHEVGALQGGRRRDLRGLRDLHALTVGELRRGAQHGGGGRREIPRRGHRALSEGVTSRGDGR